MRFEHVTFARAGLIGNPSDGYGGKVIAIPIHNFSARVSLEPADEIEYVGSANELLRVATRSFLEYAKNAGIELPDKKFKLTLIKSNIPFQVGLAGSSAITTAVVKCLNDFYGKPVPSNILPGIALEAEINTEWGLNNTAGLQEIAVQIYNRPVLTDVSDIAIKNGVQVGKYIFLNKKLIPENLFLVYLKKGGERSGIIHSGLKERFDRGEPKILEAMRTLAKYTNEFVEALNAKDVSLMIRLMNANFDLRRKIFGDAALGLANIDMMQVARKYGSFKFPGSGGAGIGLCETKELLEVVIADLNSDSRFHAMALR